MSAWKIYTFALRWRIGYKLFAVSIVSLLAQLLSYQGKPKRLSLLRIISRSRLALPRKDVWSHRFICYFVKAYSTTRVRHQIAVGRYTVIFSVYK